MEHKNKNRHLKINLRSFNVYEKIKRTRSIFRS